MKTISEVVNLLGVTRRTLQEYDNEEVQLLHPCKKDDTDKGKWLYDDEALQKLEIITVFREIGYKRSEIKDILNKPSVDLAEEFKKGKQKLLEKKERIEAMVSYFDMYIFVSSIPLSFFEYLENVSGKLNGKRRDIDTILSLGRVFLTEGKNQLNEETAPLVKLIILISYIPIMKAKSPKSDEVQDYIEMVFKYYIGIYVDRNERASELVSSEQRDSIIESMLNDKEHQYEWFFNPVDLAINEKSFQEYVDNEFGSLELRKNIVAIMDEDVAPVFLKPEIPLFKVKTKDVSALKSTSKTIGLIERMVCICCMIRRWKCGENAKIARILPTKHAISLALHQILHQK